MRSDPATSAGRRWGTLPCLQRNRVMGFERPVLLESYERATGKEQLVKAHRAESVKFHIGTKVHACNVDLREPLSAWLDLARSVQVPGSVEEERTFSKLAFIKDERRKRREAEHLNVCLIQATQHIFSFTDFPFIAAMQKWFAAKERRHAAVPGQPYQPRKPIVIRIDSNG
eukprot:1145213-Pelagomonas_calceolata.AAC.5